MIDLTLRDAYRTSDVERWSIVRTRRRQTVAEHSYHVAMIAMRLADLLGMPEESRGEVLWAALTHDMAEVLTGDMATPLKDLLGPSVNAELHKLEENISVNGRSLGPNKLGIIQDLIKIADLVEAVAFISQHGAGSHARQVGAKLAARVRKYGDLAEQVMFEVMEGPEHTLDDLVEDYET